jgi:hypothetical protein
MIRDVMMRPVAAAAAAAGQPVAAAAGRLISDPLNVELVEEFELTSKIQIQRMSEKLVIGPKI